MNSVVRSNLALLCVLLVAAPPTVFAADQPQSAPPPQAPGTQRPIKDDGGTFGRFTAPYRAAVMPDNNLANSTRIESLIRAGNLYLSLQDTIALALENNLDIAIQRYGPMIAESALQIANAGGIARGVSTNVTAGPNSASVSSAGTSANTQSATAASSAASSSAVGGSVVQTSGPSLPSLDPVFISNFNWAHVTAAQSSAFLTGSNALIQQQNVGNFLVSKGFLTGTTVSMGLNNTNSSSNNPRNDFNPSTSSSLALTVSQHLLQGFGSAVNGRSIRIARNNREVSDLTFKLQVETTVAAVMNLYWDLVSFNKSGPGGQGRAECLSPTAGEQPEAGGSRHTGAHRGSPRRG